MGFHPTGPIGTWVRGSLGRVPWTAAVRAGAVLVLCAVAVTRRLAWPPDTLWLVALLAAGFGSKVFLRHLAPFLALFVLYFVLSGLADDLNPTVHYLPMARFDRWLMGGGELPTQWLQRHLWNGSLHWYDFGFYLLYTAHFVTPVVIAVLVWKRRPRLYWTYVGAIMGLSFAAFATYALFPAAPPWLSSDYRRIPPIHRVSHDIWQAVGITDPDTLYSRLSPNLVAAVPSLHASYPLLILIFLARAFGWRRVWWAAVYPAALWTGIVYMGEHYVFDILAGVAYTLIACALAFWTSALVSRRDAAAWRDAGLRPEWPKTSIPVVRLAGMAGRIRQEDIALVRERSPIDQVIGEYLQLVSAGGGNAKGLCPFHDEKTPSFNVTPSRGLYFCHGCGVGGDVIKFVQEIDHLSFAEAVERLAAKAGVQLQYEEGGYTPRRDGGQRARLIEAHRVAAEFYAAQLSGPQAEPGRRFLMDRGFQAADAAHFGIGYAPNEWEALVRHLRGKGFTDREMIVGGLCVEGRRGPRDRFRGRLVWPIRDVSGDVIGFGARKLLDTDDGPKYLNTPETPIYHKSSVLYGLDLAKREIARAKKAVIVEGYTDVMACHLAGETTAIATCGTAFGDEHIKVLRRVLLDQDEGRGEIIFTFDGDSAGQKAALNAFKSDHKFASQTFVAVQPDGLDPCELRVKHGDAAVRDLIASRVPLFEFAIRSRIGGFDLDNVEGQMKALDAVAPIIAGIRDAGRRKLYAVNLDRWLGIMDEQLVLRRINEHMKGAARPPAPRTAGPQADPGDPSAELERELLKMALQRPATLGPAYDTLAAEAFAAPEHRAVHEVILAGGGAGGAVAPLEWAARLRELAPNEEVRTALTRLSVEPPKAAAGVSDDAYSRALLARFMELQLTRQITALKSKLGRLNPVSEAEEYNRMFGDLVALEQQRRRFRDQGVQEW